MKGKNVAVMLKQEASNNVVFSAMCHVFAERERARSQVTIHSLTANMEKRGFKFTREQYTEALKFMAHLGLGTLAYNKNKRVIALTGIKLKLQSIGKAATSEANLTDFRSKAGKTVKYEDLKLEKAESEPMHIKTFVEQPKRGVRAPQPYPTFLTVLIEGKPVTFPGPSTVTADTLTDFLVQYRDMVKGKEL